MLHNIIIIYFIRVNAYINNRRRIPVERSNELIIVERDENDRRTRYGKN